ncbi:MAG TPA: 23S rRNA (adenine(2503)-C(2))-methyltransferase RlmN [bacterium]|nr:23S rRNA (adenine(2503)-C(2))-methyltransferase RlmN [bacterium]
MNWLTWQDFISSRPAFRRKQLEKAVFQQLISDWSEATTLPASDREWLSLNCPLTIKAEFLGQEDKGAEKARLELSDGYLVETVLMRHADGRRTVCLSSQVGCPLGCAFCATGQLGFKRNLVAYEIIEQILLWQRRLALVGEKVDNVVFMGMGEPLLNLEEVLKAIEILHNPEALAIGWRHIAISTVGLVPEIKQLMNFGQQIKLAWSLHAADNRLRDRLMPINKRYNLEQVKRAMLEYAQTTNRRIMVEYLLLDGVNDSADQAEKLTEFLDDFPKNLIVINILTYNPSDGNFRASRLENRRDFVNILKRRGYGVTERLSLGQEVVGACGQLGRKN